jgi:hypothetical protein
VRANWPIWARRSFPPQEDNLAAQDEAVEDRGDSAPALLKRCEESGLGSIKTTGLWRSRDRRQMIVYAPVLRPSKHPVFDRPLDLIQRDHR